MKKINNCLICNSNENRLFAEIEDHGYKLSYKICKNCGMVFQSHQMTDLELNKFYQSEYRKIYQLQEEPTTKDIFIQKKRAESLLQFFRKHYLKGNNKKPQNHLDIGCSAGILLEYFNNKIKTDMYGIEPGDAYREHAKLKGITVFSSIEELIEKQNSKFDLISLSHVIEHLPDPVCTLLQLKTQLLSDDGIILIETPNLISSNCFEVAHVTAFSPHTLSQTLNKAGYKIFAKKCHGIPRSALVPLYITILARQSAKTSSKFKPDRLIKLYRLANVLYLKIVSRLFHKKTWLPLN